MSIYAKQVAALADMVKHVDMATKSQLLASHCESLMRQLASKMLTEDEVKVVNQVVQDSVFEPSQKGKLTVALSNCMLRQHGQLSGRKVPQKLVDLGPYLTQSEMTSLQGAIGLNSKVHVLAGALMRLNLTNPNEQAYGTCIQFLCNLGNGELKDPNSFLACVNLLKGMMKDHRKASRQALTYISEYNGVPSELPSDLYDSAYQTEKPLGTPSSTVTAKIGPLRKTNKGVSSSSSSSHTQSMDPFQGFTGLVQSFVTALNHARQPDPPTSHSQPVLALANTPFNEPPPNEGASHAVVPVAKTTPVESQDDQTRQNQPVPLSPSSQARQMLEAWGHDGSEHGPPSRGRGRGHGRGRGRGRGRGAHVDQANGHETQDGHDHVRGRGRGLKRPAARSEGGRCMKARAKPKAKAKAKPTARPKAKAILRRPAAAHRGRDVPGMTWEQRLEQRPNGCAGCRWKPGCCPSCWAR